MGIKKKAFGFIMAIGMTFSLVGAATADTTVDGSVELDGGSCSVAVENGTFDMGTATWTGSSWSYTPTQNSARITVDVTPGWTAPGSTGQCSVTVDTEDGLSNGTHTIQRGSFSSGYVPNVVPAPIVGEQTLPGTFDMRAGEGDVTMRISTPLHRSFSPGEYTGTFVFTVGDGQ